MSDPIAELRAAVGAAAAVEWPEPYGEYVEMPGWRERRVDTAHFLRLLDAVEAHTTALAHTATVQARRAEASEQEVARLRAELEKAKDEVEYYRSYLMG